MGQSDDFTCVLDDAADGDFVAPPSVDRLVVGETHKKRVVAGKLRREKFFERTLLRDGCGHVGGDVNAAPSWVQLEVQPAAGKGGTRENWQKTVLLVSRRFHWMARWKKNAAGVNS
jgi:hypothetical protein